MKKLILFLIAVSCCSAFSYAQEDENSSNLWKRGRFFNFTFADQTLKGPDPIGNQTEWKSDFALAVQLGNTYFLHKKPIGGFLKFGIDAVWMDINYANYEDDYNHYSNNQYDSEYDDYYDYDFNLGMHQIEYGMHVGPSITVTPFKSFSSGIKHLRIFTYFHYTPTYSLILFDYDDDIHVNHGFCSFFNTGGGISYKLIGAGVEYRWGSGKYEVDHLFENSSDDKMKFKTSALRAYITLRF